MDRTKPFTVRELADTNPDAGLTCGDCGTFPEFWAADSWNCRRRGRSVDRTESACELWRDRIPAPEVSMEEARQTLETVLYGLLPPFQPKDTKVVPRVYPPGLRWTTDGVVYFIDCGPLTKVGHTYQHVAKRLDGIRGHNPFPIKLWALFPGTPTTEREFHDALDDAHYSREWFQLDDMRKCRIRAFVSENGGEVFE